MADKTSYVGWWYETGPASPHRVVSDEHEVPGCVTVENAAGQRVPVSRVLIAQIAAPAGMTWHPAKRAYVPLPPASSN